MKDTTYYETVRTDGSIDIPKQIRLDTKITIGTQVKFFVTSHGDIIIRAADKEVSKQQMLVDILTNGGSLNRPFEVKNTIGEFIFTNDNLGMQVGDDVTPLDNDLFSALMKKMVFQEDKTT
jgi:bifunctional DNA-binding transcriptional regulator/antitoxin component of YhaV-PrlF toxin-antitoxin module